MSFVSVWLTLFSLNEDNPALDAGPVTLGPFDFVQLTYDDLRVERAEPGDDRNAFLGHRTEEGYWALVADDGPDGRPLYPEVLPHLGKRFSDVTISTESGP